MTKYSDPNEIKCSFCGKTQQEVKRLIAGVDAFICNECIELGVDILNEEMSMQGGSIEKPKLLKPKEIVAALSEYVIGQDEAKKSLAVAVYNHYKRIQNLGTTDSEVELQKSNVLLIGPTGSGKTLLAQIMAKTLNVPFAIADATALTEAGYVGEDVENILLRLIQAANFNVEEAQRGIIYIDEIDKIARKSDNPSITRGRKHPSQEFIAFDTTNVLFICGGAFDGLDKIIQRRVGEKSIGFKIENMPENEKLKDEEILSALEPEDLLRYGLIPEFIGRLPSIVALNKLDEDALIEIITKPKNALIKQYKELFAMDGVELEIEESAIRKIAQNAIKRKTGARGLRGIMEAIMRDLMYEIPSDDNIKKCVITEEMV